MSGEILLQIFLFGIALSMDAFAVAVTQGLTVYDMNKKRTLFIATVYGVFQALFPLIGFFLVEIVGLIVTKFVGDSKGFEYAKTAGNVMSTVVSWISFVLLLYIGGKMLIDAIKNMQRPEYEKDLKMFNVKEVIVMGIATAIDALATGVAFHSGLSTTTTIWFHAFIIMVCTFVISLIGIILAGEVHKMLNGKYEVTSIIGGAILISLGIWVIISHYA